MGPGGFTPDGRYLVGGSFKGWVRLWSTETWKPASRRFTGHAGRVEWQSISPDGRTLATGGPDGTVRLWDLPTQQPLGAPLPGRTDRYLLPQFTPDGAYLFAIATGRAYRWDVRPASWARLACSVAGRTSPDPSGRTHCPNATTTRPAERYRQPAAHRRKYALTSSPRGHAQRAPIPVPDRSSASTRVCERPGRRGAVSADTGAPLPVSARNNARLRFTELSDQARKRASRFLKLGLSRWTRSRCRGPASP